MIAVLLTISTACVLSLTFRRLRRRQMSRKWQSRQAWDTVPLCPVKEAELVLVPYILVDGSSKSEVKQPVLIPSDDLEKCTQTIEGILNFFLSKMAMILHFIESHLSLCMPAVVHIRVDH